MSDFLNWELTNRMHNLGYDGKTLMYIDDEEDIINDDSAELIGAKPAILTSAAFRWFREKHGMVFNLISSTYYYPSISFVNIDGNSQIELGEFNSYEESELECLRRLIKICKYAKI